MARTLSTTLTAAIAGTVTTPIYLARIGFTVENYVSTWGAAILYGSNSYIASGMEITALSDTRATITLPATDYWIGLTLGEGVRDRNIYIYRHYKDVTASPDSDTVLVFQGVMDTLRLEDRVRIDIIEASQVKQFPPTLIDAPTFNFLPVAGTRIQWRGDTIVVN